MRVLAVLVDDRRRRQVLIAAGVRVRTAAGGCIEPWFAPHSCAGGSPWSLLFLLAATGGHRETSTTAQPVTAEERSRVTPSAPSW